MYVVVVQTFTFAISSPDEFLLYIGRLYQVSVSLRTLKWAQSGSRDPFHIVGPVISLERVMLGVSNLV